MDQLLTAPELREILHTIGDRYPEEAAKLRGHLADLAEVDALQALVATIVGPEMRAIRGLARERIDVEREAAAAKQAEADAIDRQTAAYERRTDAIIEQMQDAMPRLVWPLVLLCLVGVVWLARLVGVPLDLDDLPVPIPGGL